MAQLLAIKANAAMRPAIGFARRHVLRTRFPGLLCPNGCLRNPNQYQMSLGIVRMGVVAVDSTGNAVIPAQWVAPQIEKNAQ